MISNLRARVVREPRSVLKPHHTPVAADDLVGLRVDGGGCLPVGEGELPARWKVDRELTSLGPQPEPFFAAVNVDVGNDFSRRDVLVIEPAVALASIAGGGRCHDAALVCGHDSNSGAVGAVTQHNRLDVPREERHVLPEVLLGVAALD